MVSLLSANACLEAEKEAAMKQAQSASRAAEELMKGGEVDSEMKTKLKEKEAGTLLSNTPKYRQGRSRIAKYLRVLKCHIRDRPDFFISYQIHILDLSKALKDVASMKAQAENLSAEYDRLCDEKNALERRLAIQGEGDKKAD